MSMLEVSFYFTNYIRHILNIVNFLDKAGEIIIFCQVFYKLMENLEKYLE